MGGECHLAEPHSGLQYMPYCQSDRMPFSIYCLPLFAGCITPALDLHCTCTECALEVHWKRARPAVDLKAWKVNGSKSECGPTCRLWHTCRTPMARSALKPVISIRVLLRRLQRPSAGTTGRPHQLAPGCVLPRTAARRLLRPRIEVPWPPAECRRQRLQSSPAGHGALRCAAPESPEPERSHRPWTS